MTDRVADVANDLAEEVILRRDQSVRGRPFTSVDLYDRDHAVLTAMVEDLRVLLARADTGALTITAHKRIAWKVHGLTRRVIVCDPQRLVSTRRACIVGFFGQRRKGADLEPLEQANAAIVRQFRDFPGILSYSSWELPGHNWANLVVSDRPGVSEEWRANELHRRAAAELSPTHYRNVRIHQGVLPGGIKGGQWVTLERTRYVDYRARRVWRARRDLTGTPGS